MRFQVKLDECKAFKIVDTQYRMPDNQMACVIYFKRQEHAEAIARLMNDEWSRFLAKPE